MKIIDGFFNFLFVIALALLCISAGINIEKWRQREVEKREIRFEMYVMRGEIEKFENRLNSLSGRGKIRAMEMGQEWFEGLH